MSTTLLNNVDLWTSAVRHKSTAGRGSNRKLELAGINKLRELILELAVRGKLVPQNPDDEPASELLKRIEAEKAQLIKDGKLKKQKTLPAVSDDEKPFELPQGWEWVRLGILGNTQTGGTPAKGKPEYFDGDIPFVKPGDIDKGKLNESGEFLSESGILTLGREVPEGTILMVCIGTIGKCAITTERCSFNQQINSITPFLPMGPYLLKALSSPYFQECAWQNSSSTTISILNKGKWESICVPLPPLAEQQRIVAKVDELMALCDQLEQQSEHQLDAHQQLTETLLSALLTPAAGALTNATSAQELSDNWQRLAQHFDLLFSGPMGAWAIDRLKDTILQLAVMGKLVPQNPDDEPAAELLKRIDAEKNRLVKEGKIKKQKPLPPVNDDEKPFELPEGWIFVRLGSLSNITGGFAFKSTNYIESGSARVIRISDFNENGLLEENIVRHEYDASLEQFKLENNNILMAMTGGTVGKACLVKKVDSLMVVNQRVATIKPPKELPSEYLYGVLKSSHIQNVISEAKNSTNDNISMGDITGFYIPLPPLAEQHRIVAKVDELFALCDQLKERLQHASDTQLNLTDAIVEQALN